MSRDFDEPRIRIATAKAKLVNEELELDRLLGDEKLSASAVGEPVQRAIRKAQTACEQWRLALDRLQTTLDEAGAVQSETAS
jgi:hypothetical protein